MTTQKRGRPAHQDLLTPAEWRILHATRHGFSNKAMAERMGISINAVKYHLRNILAKTGLRNKKALRQLADQPKEFTNFSTGKQELPMSTGDIKSIGQIARTVSDLESSRNFFELVLELPLLYTFPELAFFDIGGTRLMLRHNGELNANESILYLRVDDIAAVHEKLLEKDVEFIAAPHRIHRHEDGTEEWMAFFKDPDGRPLALMSQVSPK